MPGVLKTKSPHSADAVMSDGLVGACVVSTRKHCISYSGDKDESDESEEEDASQSLNIAADASNPRQPQPHQKLLPGSQHVM